MKSKLIELGITIFFLILALFFYFLAITTEDTNSQDTIHCGKDVNKLNNL